MSTIPTQFSQDFIPGNVKAAMSGAGASSGDLWRVPVAQLHRVPGLNVRTHNEEYTAHVERISKSILAEGFYQDKPIAVYIDESGRICVKDGYSRLDAVDLAIAAGAQISTLPCVTAPKGTNMTDIMVGLVKSNTGKPLLPIEVAVVCKRLVGWGMDPKEVAERLDYTVPYVNDLLGLLEAPAALRDLVSAGKVSASTAIKTSKREGVKKATETLVAASAQAKGGKVTTKTLKPTKAAGDAPDLRKVIKAVYDDAGFAKLDAKTQDKVLDIINS